MPPCVYYNGNNSRNGGVTVTTQTENLCGDRVFYHFRSICKIPHGSGNEKALSDYIYNWATEIGLEAWQDDAENVFVKKPASPDRKNAPAVMLQAHIDMVCEKGEGVRHDFEKDPIDWVIDGDLLSTGGKTTLGADDGIGAALIMAVLEDNTLSHPAIEALFTTMEEEDMSGAERFDGSSSNAAYLINLDHTVESEVVCGSCGGMQADFRLKAEMKEIPKDWDFYVLSVSGLKGGHSGEDIHRGRGNANILLARLLESAEKRFSYLIAGIKGGSFRLAIPREAEAVICMSAEEAEGFRKILSGLETDMRAELAGTGENLRVSLETLNAGFECETAAKPEKIVSALLLIPDGIYQMNEVLTGLVDTSDNLGEVYLDGEDFHAVLEIRSARESLRSYIYARLERLAGLLGGSCEFSRTYPSWNFHPVSELRQLCRLAYKEVYGGELTVHAGLEVGYLLERRPETDAISIGPNCKDFHSPTESVEISSVKKFHKYLCKLLALIR